MKNNPTPNSAIITEDAVRRKEDTENRNNRMKTRTVSKTINDAAINFDISLISLASFYLCFIMRAQGQRCCRWLVNLVLHIIKGSVNNHCSKLYFLMINLFKCCIIHPILKDRIIFYIVTKSLYFF